MPDGGIIRIPTADGARIATKRKPTPNGFPVIFLHGLAVNADLWDIPDVIGDDVHFRSLPTILHEAGGDIWLVNLRGHGAPRMLSEPPPGMHDWCVDHFILYDLPAVIAHVRSATGLPPFIVANSMGAMTAAGYFQGAVLAGAPPRQHVALDAAEAQRRQAQVGGCVFVEFPAALRWPKSPFDEHGELRWREFTAEWLRNDASVNFPFEILSRFGWLEALIQAAGSLPLEWMRARGVGGPWWQGFPGPLADFCRSTEQAMLRALRGFAEKVKGSPHFHPDTFLNGPLRAVDHMKAGVLSQLAASVRAGAFVSGIGEPLHFYSDHYDQIVLPALVLSGLRDRIANAAVTREVFYDQIRSEDKTLHEYEDIAHGDFEYAPVACERVYPTVRAWILDRMTTGVSCP